ncbi:hypothetical protein GT347_02745 [Xylophilus rhododendri]|uniref:O-antigen ligase-related domain-containing protein n=1 Tax=Xylophilus rhododendri TaxID=2697032 RepID=A0A857J228_9BURK|nr:O-antigen ligase family protein [Xylophilus rhododendri]QHI96998.1 hypothetical protein GT347_02745 [Xylophilus rhododendri]
MEIIIWAVLGLLAALAAFGVIFTGIIGIQFSRNLKEGLLPYFFYPALFSSGLMVLLSSRTFSVDGGTNEALVNSSAAAAVWAIRLNSIFTLIAVADQVVRYFATRPKIDAPRALLFLAFCLFWVTNVPIAAYFASHQVAPELQWVYGPALIFGLLCLSREGAHETIKSSRNAIILYCAAGLVLIFIMPDKVLDRQYAQGYVPGLPRFSGLAPHAITLGLTASIALWCLITEPLKTKWINRSAWAICLLTLFLAQSKTVWMAFLVGAPILKYYQNGLPKLTARGIGRLNVLYFIVPAGMIGVSCIVAAYFLFGNGADRLQDFLQTKQGAQILTGTGRDLIWEIALREWHASPIFGYGLNLFDFDYRTQIHMSNATSGHNQFIDALGRTGIVGCIGFSIYLFSLLFFGFRYASQSSGLTLVVSLLILVRSITEVAISPAGIGITETASYVLIAALAACFTKAQVVNTRKFRTVSMPNQIFNKTA